MRLIKKKQISLLVLHCKTETLLLLLAQLSWCLLWLLQYTLVLFAFADLHDRVDENQSV
jgi:hypothetical protein